VRNSSLAFASNSSVSPIFCENSSKVSAGGGIIVLAEAGEYGVFIVSYLIINYVAGDELDNEY